MTEEKEIIGTSLNKQPGGSKMLSANLVSSIQVKLEAGVPVKKIARELKVAPQTVRRYRDRPERKMRPAVERQKLEANQEKVRALYFKYGQNCSVVQRELKDTLGLTIGIRTLQRFCEKYKAEAFIANNEPTKRFETAPGQQMQIDFGEIDVEIGGVNTRVHFFCAKMGYSRRIYAKPYFAENQDTWLDGIESAFQFFGGVPLEIVCDNTRCLVVNHNLPSEQRYTERFITLCNYYGVRPIATSVRLPQSKGKVENAVKYVKGNALIGRSFDTMEEAEKYLERWSLEVNDTHTISDPMLEGAKTPKERWALEKPALTIVNKAPLMSIRRETRVINKNGLLRVDNDYYRVPDFLINKKVQILISQKEITISCAGQKAYTLAKAEAKVTPEQQKPSNVQSNQDRYNNRLHELEQRDDWIPMQNPEIQRAPDFYECLFMIMIPVLAYLLFA